MYCGQCGKKVMENMLFCPFCGSPIVIPEQDGHVVPTSIQAESEIPATERQETEVSAPEEVQEETFVQVPPADIPERPVSLFAEVDATPKHEEKNDAEKEGFVPLSFDFEPQKGGMEDPEGDGGVVSPDPEVNIPLDVLDEFPPRPVRRPAPDLRRPERNQKRPVNTYIPVKEIDPDDMFMDGFGGEDEDEYDLDDAPVRGRAAEPDFDFEEPERGGFFQRHIRGIVGLILLLIMLVICAAWAFSPKGQETLARINLAWDAEAYADLGYKAYHQDSDLLAARYYEKALSRDTGNYEYAHSAMVAYYEAHEIESAAAMLKKCIEMAPDNPEPYQEMLILYPDRATRPWEINELIRLGYQRTGNEALNVG